MDVVHAMTGVELEGSRPAAMQRITVVDCGVGRGKPSEMNSSDADDSWERTKARKARKKKKKSRQQDDDSSYERKKKHKRHRKKDDDSDSLSEHRRKKRRSKCDYDSDSSDVARRRKKNANPLDINYNVGDGAVLRQSWDHPH